MPCGRLGPSEIAIIVLLAALLFGARKLPELGKGIGQGMKNFKRGIEGQPVRKRRKR